MELAWLTVKVNFWSVIVKIFANAAAELWADESGISSVEYALLLSFVAGAIMVAAWVLASSVEGSMTGAAACVRGTIEC
jgi:Flp pilus assembly pilin Flp